MEDRAVQADRYLTELIEQADRLHDLARPEAAEVEPGRPYPPAVSRPGERPRPTDQAEVLELARAALGATNRLAHVVDVIGSQVDAATADLLALRRAVGESLDATNQRLAALEHLLLPDSAPAAAPAESATARLSDRLRPAVEG